MRLNEAKNILQRNGYRLDEEEDGRFHDKPYSPTENEIADSEYCVDKLADMAKLAENEYEYVSNILRNFKNGHYSVDDFNEKIDDHLWALVSLEKKVKNIKELLDDLRL